MAVTEGDLLIMDTVYMDNSANLTVLCWKPRELFVLLWWILLLQNLGKYCDRGELSVVYNEKIITMYLMMKIMTRTRIGKEKMETIIGMMTWEGVAKIVIKQT